ncbi:MAG: YcxB family protein [Clostridiaceae bacterium]|nr:YcxB family protein [Clostridiaceae bacterium]
MIIGFDNGSFSWTRLIISWILLFALAVAVIVLKVERKNAQRVKTDKTGAFDSVSTLKFYDDRMVMENESLKSSSELKYDQFFALMESKDYFIFYLTVNQASLIRKKDVDNLEVFKVFIVDKFNSRYKKI